MVADGERADAGFRTGFRTVQIDGLAWRVFAAHGGEGSEQLAPLRELGSWLRLNGEAIYATRPWETASSITTAGSAVRFTQRGGEVYAILLDLPMRSFGFRGLDAPAVSDVRVLGLDEPVDWQVADGMLNITLPQRMPVSPAHVVALGRGARPA